MKTLTEKRALTRLKTLKAAYQNEVKETYEVDADDCTTCETKGACCLDAHFVNVHISRLEAVAIGKTLAELGEQKAREIFERAQQTIEKYDLTGDVFDKTYACPLFEKTSGCLVHNTPKPSPCIQHACYENKEDLPPDSLQTEVEKSVERLNKRTYGNAWNYLPLPVWLAKIAGK